MRGYFGVAGVACMLALWGACAQPNGPGDGAALTRDEKWRADIAVLAKELPARHPNAFTLITRSAFNAQIDALRNQVPTASDVQLLGGIMRVVASIGDAHTWVQPKSAMRTAPIEMYWFDDGTWITTAPDFTSLVGTRVVSIWDIPIDSANVAAGRLVSHDNDAWLRAGVPALLRTPIMLAAAGMTSDTNSIELEYAAESGGGEVTLPASFTPASTLQRLRVATPRAPLLLPAVTPRPNYSFAMLPSESALYFQYNACVDAPAGSFAAFNRDIQAALTGQRPSRVIIDLRQNGGGNSAVLQPFITGLKEWRAANPQARVFALVSRHTISSASMNALDLRAAGAVIVGEPTGGAPNHFGEVKSFVLPHSGLTVFHSTKFFTQVPGNTDRSIIPDVRLPVLFSDYRAGRDPAMEYALTH